MSNLAEIEAAIEKLSPEQVEELTHRLEERRRERADARERFDRWLERAQGVARDCGMTTDEIMELNRGES